MRFAFDPVERTCANVPADLEVHLVMDTCATHKTRLIRERLAKRPRWQVHVTPTGSSWINQVEHFFALLTDQQIRRGVHASVQKLEDDIRTFIQTNTINPKPFRWTKSAHDILASIERSCLRNSKTTETSDSAHQVTDAYVRNHILSEEIVIALVKSWDDGVKVFDIA